jgi:hypothetical protein
MGGDSGGEAERALLFKRDSTGSITKSWWVVEALARPLCVIEGPHSAETLLFSA